MSDEFTVRDAVAWLGLTWEQYQAMNEVLQGIHGGPQVDAILAIQHERQRAATTPEAVLAQCGIDPANPIAAARAYRRRRASLADEPMYGADD